jgi:outer membrane receptor protein involved in Fe transport
VAAYRLLLSQYAIRPFTYARLYSVEGQYTSRRTTVAGPVLGSFVVVNATLLGRRLVRNLDISANVDNLFDKRYADSGSLETQEISIEQDGRSFRIKLTYNFSSR